MLPTLTFWKMLQCTVHQELETIDLFLPHSLAKAMPDNSHRLLENTTSNRFQGRSRACGLAWPILGGWGPSDPCSNQGRPTIDWK